MPITAKPPKERLFSRYQVFLIVILAIIQFSVILDFMVLSPLGVMLIDKLHIEPSQFGIVVSVYAFSAGASGLIAAGFADRFDRKKLLIFFYSGFIAGTFLCAIAASYQFLLAARIVTGIFGGVLGSVSFAIISDLFRIEVRGRVMGFVQMSFSAAQVLGLPIGLRLATQLNWHAPFWLIVGLGTLSMAVIVLFVRPVTAHLALTGDRKNPFHHLARTISQKNYLRGFFATVLLATGGFMLMPFGTTFTTGNLGIALESLPTIYFVTGVCSIVFGPLVGKLSDKVGKYRIFAMGTTLSMIMVAIYTNLGITPFIWVVVLNSVLFVGITSRMISSSALMTAVPEPQDRGAFMSINSSLAQIAGGIASAVAGLIVVRTKSGFLRHYDVLGYVVMGTMTVTLVLMYRLNQQVMEKQKTQRNGSQTIAKVETGDNSQLVLD